MPVVLLTLLAQMCTSRCFLHGVFATNGLGRSEIPRIVRNRTLRAPSRCSDRFRIRFIGIYMPDEFYRSMQRPPILFVFLYYAILVTTTIFQCLSSLWECLCQLLYGNFVGSPKLRYLSFHILSFE